MLVVSVLPSWWLTITILCPPWGELCGLVVLPLIPLIASLLTTVTYPLLLSRKYKNLITDLKQTWDQEVDRLYALKSEHGNTQTEILGTLNKFVGENDVIVCAAGSLPGDLQRLWRSQKP